MDPMYRAEYGDLPAAGNLIDCRYETTGGWKYIEFPSLNEYIFPRDGILIYVQNRNQSRDSMAISFEKLVLHQDVLG